MPDQLLTDIITITRRTTASVNTLGENVYTWTNAYSGIKGRVENWSTDMQYRKSGERAFSQTVCYLQKDKVIQTQEIADTAADERGKEVMAKEGGGGQTSQFTPDGTPLVDKLIAGRPNPNSFFGGA